MKVGYGHLERVPDVFHSELSACEQGLKTIAEFFDYEYGDRNRLHDGGADIDNINLRS